MHFYIFLYDAYMHCWKDVSGRQLTSALNGLHVFKTGLFDDPPDLCYIELLEREQFDHSTVGK